MECVEWEGRAQQRGAELREVRKETDKQAKNYASRVKPLANNSKMFILLGSGKIMAAATSKRKSPEGDWVHVK